MNTIIVVGAGILGASTAYHLVKMNTKVILIDRGDPGQATNAAAGIICPWLTQRRNKAWYHLAKSGAKYYPSLIGLLEEDGQTETGYSQVGALSLHYDDSKLDAIEERAYKRREDAPEIGTITRLTPAETMRLFPPLAEKYGSVHISGGARVNGKALKNALIRAAIKRGITYIQGDASLVCQENRVTGVRIDNGDMMLADKVIVTTGAWANELLKPLHHAFSVSEQKAQIIHLEIPNQRINTNLWPVIMPPNNQYILSFENGRIVVGATHEDHTGFDLRITAGGVHEILSKALEIAPGLAQATVLETKVGFRPFTEGFLPVIDSFPNIEGLLFSNGLGASGLTVGPYLGSELAKLAVGVETELHLADYKLPYNGGHK